MSHPSLNKMLQIEQVCDRFESAWQLGDRPQIEDSLRQFPEVATDLLKPLLTMEIDYRRQRGEKPLWGEYLPRFPQAVAILTELLGPNLTAEIILEQITNIGLVAPHHLAALQQRKANRPATFSGEDLLGELVASHILTAYQAKRIAAGKSKSLTLEKFILLDKLGQGGMGTVWKAWHREADEIVALKVLDPALTQRKDMLSRFQRESRLATLLKHPNIVATYRAAQHGANHFLVMEYIDGIDLASQLKAEGPVSISTAVEWVSQIANGLESAHQQGIIHRDIKLANLLRERSGIIKILDLGLARIEGDGETNGNLTGTGDFMGTVDYISPEQAMSAKNADARSDIYSLGIVLWYLLLDRPAYDGKSIASRIIAHRDAPIPSLATALASSEHGQDPGLDKLDAIFRTMVAKNPADRYQSMTEVIAALAVLRESASGN